jgi:hypothetical protein
LIRGVCPAQFLVKIKGAIRKLSPSENPNERKTSGLFRGRRATNVRGQIRYHAYISSRKGERKKTRYIKSADHNQILFHDISFFRKAVNKRKKYTGRRNIVAYFIKTDRRNSKTDNQIYRFLKT